MKDRFKNVNCPVCGCEDYKKIFDLEYSRQIIYEKLNVDSPDNLELRNCKNCNHFYSSHQLPQEIIDAYYSEMNSEYFNITEEPNETHNYQDKKLVDIVTKIKDSGKILDVGCGYGFLLEKFDEFKWNRFGIDPSRHAVNFARHKLNLNVKLGYLNLDTFVDQKFDVILCFDVFEHLNDPNKLVELMLNYLDQDGLLVVGTGNINSLNFKIARQKWGYFGSHEHISFFNDYSIKYLLNRNGLKVERLIRKSYQGNLTTNIKRLVKNFILMQLYNLKLKPNIISIPIAYDHMIVIAKKLC